MRPRSLTDPLNNLPSVRPTIVETKLQNTGSLIVYKSTEAYRKLRGASVVFCSALAVVSVETKNRIFEYRRIIVILF